MNQTQYSEEKYPLSALTGRIIAAAQAVHRELGPGFNEIIYQRSMALELPIHEVEFAREVELEIFYRGKKVGVKRVDFVLEDQTGQVMVEFKAKSQLEDVDYVQTLSYLKASNSTVGLLINFGEKSLVVRRLAHTKQKRT